LKDPGGPAEIGVTDPARICDPALMPGSAVDITAPDGIADGYLARPDDRPHPGVLLIMDALSLLHRTVPTFYNL